MHSTKLIRWSGLAAMLGGGLWAGLEIVTISAWSQSVFGFTYEDYNRIKSFPLLLLMVGLVGFYAPQQSRAGKLGLVGVILGTVGLSLMMVGNVIEFWIGGGIRYGDKAISTIGWNLVLIGVPTLALGLVLFGLACYRAQVLLGWRSLAPLLTVLMPALGIGLTLAVRALLREPARRELVEKSGMVASVVLFGLGWTLLGYALWSNRSIECKESTGSE